MLADAGVAAAVVGADLAAALDVVEHEVGQHVLAGVGDAAHPGAAWAAVAALDGDRDQRLAVGTAPAVARAPRLYAADERRIDFDGAVEQLAGRTIARLSLAAMPAQKRQTNPSPQHNRSR